MTFDAVHVEAAARLAHLAGASGVERLRQPIDPGPNQSTLDIPDGHRWHSPRKSGSHRTPRWREGGFEPSVPRGKGPTVRVSVLFHSDFSVGGEPTKGDIERLVVSRGTDGSNPVPSSGESGKIHARATLPPTSPDRAPAMVARLGAPREGIVHIRSVAHSVNGRKSGSH